MMTMRTIDSKTLECASRAWQEACGRLGVRALVPSALEPRATSLACLAFLPDFGGPNGMVIGAMDLPEITPDADLEQLAKEKGLWLTFVNASAYANRKIAERIFKEALEDWGYFGPPENRPAWLTRLGGSEPGKLNGSQ